MILKWSVFIQQQLKRVASFHTSHTLRHEIHDALAICTCLCLRFDIPALCIIPCNAQTFPAATCRCFDHHRISWNNIEWHS